jgi:hypothetical protein
MKTFEYDLDFVVTLHKLQVDACKKRSCKRARALVFCLTCDSVSRVQMSTK